MTKNTRKSGHRSSTKGTTRQRSTKDTQYETLHDLLVLKLQALYDAEQEIVMALPEMIKKASSSALRTTLELHLDETKEQVGRLEKALNLLEVPPKKMKSEAIAGLVKDAEWVLKNVSDAAARDAAIIAAAQYVEHYEIAGYGVACEWSDLMHHDEVSELLKKTLAEEVNADKKLTDLAEGGINAEANKEDEDMQALRSKKREEAPIA